MRPLCLKVLKYHQSVKYPSLLRALVEGLEKYLPFPTMTPLGIKNSCESLMKKCTQNLIHRTKSTSFFCMNERDKGRRCVNPGHKINNK
jgi:hypothetical protein